MVKPDPSVRKDGTCVVCRKPRHPEWTRRYAPGEAEKDPFCSTSCARAFHGNPLRPVATTTSPTHVDSRLA